ncbi:unnamed protein product [Brugia timori]|uniref:Uncharacterized protein n=1 Tax=Brugia timori TaxID=42155 RepID=A0A3P7YQT5_9BILA|nr:unnamed protein product [Brugia timori]
MAENGTIFATLVASSRPILGLNTNVSESFSQLFENEDLSIEEYEFKPDDITARNSKLSVLENPSIRSNIKLLLIIYA